MKTYIYFLSIIFICDGVQGWILLDLILKNRIYSEEAAIREMSEGTRGSLVVDVGLENKIIIRNGRKYTCPALKIDKGLLTCPDGYNRFDIKDNKDYCFSERYSFINLNGIDKFCFSSDGLETNLKIVNNDAQCTSAKKGSPHLFVTGDEFIQLCKRKPTDKVSYEFYANEKDGVPKIANPTTVICNELTCKFHGNLMVDKKIMLSTS